MPEQDQFTSEPKLKAPGQGISPFEKMFLHRVWLPVNKRLLTSQKAQDIFRMETIRTLHTYRNIPREDVRKQILIKPMLGLDDSSRYWSADMTLEHMILVTKGMVNIIQTLAREHVLHFEVRIADVKPKGLYGDLVLNAFDKTMQDTIEQLDALKTTQSKARHYHPWFGTLNAHGWHTLLAKHQKLHRRQLELIADALSSGKNS